MEQVKSFKEVGQVGTHAPQGKSSGDVWERRENVVGGVRKRRDRIGGVGGRGDVKAEEEREYEERDGGGIRRRRRRE
ncbi:hypothetical protein Tco_0672818 [Tanacetum coccineum]